MILLTVPGSTRPSPLAGAIPRNPTDGYTASILVQFAHANYTGTRGLLGGTAGGSFVPAADFGRLPRLRFRVRAGHHAGKQEQGNAK